MRCPFGATSRSPPASPAITRGPRPPPGPLPLTCRSSQAGRILRWIDVLTLLDELQAIARTGLAYTENPYDRERYERLLDLATRGLASALDLPEDSVRERLARDLGYVTAKVGADAAIFDDEDRILLVHRSDDATWGLVSGWVDPGETPADTVVREVREEVGLTAKVEALVDVVGRPAGSGYGPHGVVAVVYLCSVEPGPILVDHEATEARYLPIDEVDPWHHNHERLARLALAAHRARKAAAGACSGPVLDQVNVVTTDMPAAVSFYRALGLDVQESGPVWDQHHRAVAQPEPLHMDLDSLEFATRWNAGTTGPRPVIGFRLASREAVDELHARLVAAGHRSQQEPWDAFWGARYAVVEDPDGNPIGLMSPADDAHRSPGPEM